MRADLTDAETRLTIQRLRRILHRRGVALHEMDDIIQSAYQHLADYQMQNIVTNVEGFLVRAAINIFIDNLRKRRNWRASSRPIEELMIADPHPTPEEVHAAKRRLEHLEQGFNRLHPTTRDMVLARRMEGWTIAAIAEHHGLTISAVEKRLSRGLKFLVKWMDGW